MTKKELNTIQEQVRTYFCNRELEQINAIRERDQKKKDEHIFNYAFYDGCYKVLNALFKSATGEDVKTTKISYADGSFEWV